MATTNLSDFFRRLTGGMAAETQDDQSDRQLVERTLAGRDEAAFQAIDRTYGSFDHYRRTALKLLDADLERLKARLLED